MHFKPQVSLFLAGKNLHKKALNSQRFSVQIEYSRIEQEEKKYKNINDM